MKQAHFVRLNVNKHGVSHTLLIPVTQQSNVNRIVDLWTYHRWNVEILDTPFPGQGINATDIGVHAHD
jgi:hypothetical protein